ncbi:Receptor-interacting serine/threonine-protein kinase 1 [Marasmius crinis-equi]|uniref:Receptor-interacting serine/threonine-protein kinase 1 n=1 Tax=Marasmius crinis-equi TaxID=585013 RepID=A0ABR3G213_9AGAR
MSSDPELKRLEQTLKWTFEDKSRLQNFLAKKGRPAQQWLDSMQQLVDSPDISSEMRSSVFTAMLRLSKNSGLHPQCLAIQNVRKFGEYPIDAGGFGKVWKGAIGDSTQHVCLKVVKIYQDSDIEQLSKIFTGQHPFPELPHEAAVVLAVSSGKHPSRPEGTTPLADAMWALMQSCWDPTPVLRPTASQVVDEILGMDTLKLIRPAPKWNESTFTQVWGNINYPAPAIPNLNSPQDENIPTRATSPLQANLLSPSDPQPSHAIPEDYPSPATPRSSPPAKSNPVHSQSTAEANMHPSNGALPPHSDHSTPPVDLDVGDEPNAKTWTKNNQELIAGAFRRPAITIFSQLINRPYYPHALYIDIPILHVQDRQNAMYMNSG